MKKSPDVPSLRIRSVDDLLAVIPRVLGFHPRESLVVVVVESGGLAVTARIDLTECLTHDDRLATLWDRYPDALFLAVAHTSDPHLAWRVLDRVGAVAPGQDLVCVHADGEQWFNAPDAVGCPYDITCSAVAAQAAYEGLAVRGDRLELEASVEPVATPRQVRRALAALDRRGLDHDRLVAEALRLVKRWQKSPGRLTLVDASILALATHDLAFRESAILSTSRSNADGRVDLWTRVVQGTVPACAGHALVILGLSAWVAGNGALQVVCMERAAGLEADAEWWAFLDAVNRHVIPPTEWEQLRADWYCHHLAAEASLLQEEGLAS